MRLMALDPSSVAIGWAMFVDDRLIRAGVIGSSSVDFQSRMTVLSESVRELIETIGPDMIAIELHAGFAFARNEKMPRSPITTATLCHAQGWILGAINGKHVYIVTDTAWTKKVAKPRRIQTIRAMYPDFAETWRIDHGGDASDAVGIGLHWIAEERTKQILMRGKSLTTKLPERKSR